MGTMHERGRKLGSRRRTSSAWGASGVILRWTPAGPVTRDSSRGTAARGNHTTNANCRAQRVEVELQTQRPAGKKAPEGPLVLPVRVRARAGARDPMLSSSSS